MLTTTNDRFVIYVIRLIAAYLVVAILAFSCYKVSFSLAGRMEIAEAVLNSIDPAVMKKSSPGQARKDIEKRTNETDQAQHAQQEFLLTASFMLPVTARLFIFRGQMSTIGMEFRAEPAPGFVGVPTHPPASFC